MITLDEALAMADAPYCGECYGGERCDRCKAEDVLAAAVRSLRGKLDAALALAKQCWQYDGDLKKECAGATKYQALLDEAIKALEIAATQPPHSGKCHEGTDQGDGDCNCWKQVFVDALARIRGGKK